MKLKNYALLCLVALMAITACKKHGTAPKTIIDTDVYVVGTTTITGTDNAQHTAVAYWKNGGAAVILSKNSTYDYEVDAAFASGNDIYVAGKYDNGTTNTAVYWKTTAASEKELKGSTTGATDSYARGIGVNSAGHVYVSGRVNDAAGHHAAYWLDDGTQSVVPDINLTPSGTNKDNSVAQGMAVDGTHFYIAGMIASKATYWADGDTNNPVNLSSTINSFALSIAVSGTNIYILGYVPGTTYAQYIIWNKDASTIITPGFVADGSQGAYAIAANSTDLYAVGDIRTSPTVYYSPVYWKNNTDPANTHILTGKKGDYESVAVVGNDVYTAGGAYTADGVDDPGFAYWKNGVVSSGALAGAESVKCIAVATHPH